METLQFLIDNICADFTIDSLLGVVRACASNGPTTIGEITGAIIKKDRSLDTRCAEGLAAGAVQYLSWNKEIETDGNGVFATGLK